MTTQSEQAKLVRKIEAINHVVKNKNGYLNDLKHKIGENNLKALLQTGFVISGKEISNKDSWRVTKFAIDFANNINKKISIFDKFRYFINSKI